MAEHGRHIRSSFDAELNALTNDVLKMSALAQRLLENAIQGLFRRDTDLCNETIADDEQVDLLEKQVDREGINLLIRYQPVASDMRRIVSAMKISGNLERVADQSVAIARRVKKLNLGPSVSEVLLLEPLYREALAILRDSVQAFVEGDAELARQLKPRDRQLDRLNADFNDQAAERIMTNPPNAPTYMNLILIARALEHIGAVPT